MLKFLKSAMIAYAGALFAIGWIQYTTPNIPDIVEYAGPSVVNIKMFSAPETPIDDMMQKFNIPGFNTPNPDNKKPEQKGVGSGFIISTDGYILTNAHVVAGGEFLTVILADGKEYQARVIGSDEKTDVALIKIEGNFTALTLGNSDTAKVGEQVVAIGSPFGFEKSVTTGIISNKQRETGEYVEFIQSDVAINPGNSGGPLINMYGEVVGINSQIYTSSGGYQGISFAIPINDAMEIANILKTQGKVRRGMLGVKIGPVTDAIVEKQKLTNKNGAVITEVAKDSPAALAGIEQHDIVLLVNDILIKKTMDLPRTVGKLQPGTVVKLIVLRNGVKIQLEATLKEPD